MATGGVGVRPEMPGFHQETRAGGRTKRGAFGTPIRGDAVFCRTRLCPLFSAQPRVAIGAPRWEPAAREAPGLVSGPVSGA